MAVGRTNRSSSERAEERICVAPSIEHCLTAVPYVPGDTFAIYRTHQKCRAEPPVGIYDSHITGEGWIQEPTIFVKIGALTLSDVAKHNRRVSPRRGFYLIDEAASGSRPAMCGKVLKWWQKRNLKQFIKPA